ncbi:MAG: hypothetical protein FWG22_06520 [Prolixibacteraceae bacterium]|nr:hypothetical protein [Prolixibacteraceae bacterium]
MTSLTRKSSKPPTPPTLHTPTAHTVNIGTYTNGSITANRTTAQAGNTVTLTISPAEGYEADAITVRRSNSSATTVTLNGTGATRTFVIPTRGVYIINNGNSVIKVVN